MWRRAIVAWRYLGIATVAARRGSGYGPLLYIYAFAIVVFVSVLLLAVGSDQLAFLLLLAPYAAGIGVLAVLALVARIATRVARHLPSGNSRD